MWLLRATEPAPEDPVAATRRALHAGPPGRVLTLSLSGHSLRSRPSAAAELRAAAGAHACRLALAETRGVAVRWTDALVSGTAADLDAFLETVGPLLRRTHGRTALPTAA